MDDWRKQVADLVHLYFGVRGITRSRLELFVRHLEGKFRSSDNHAEDLSSALCDFLSNLQTLTIVLHRRPSDAEPIYVLREGRLAGELTTQRVRGKSPREIFPPEVNAVTLPMVERAFAGQEVEFTYTLGERTFLTLLHPYQRDASGNVTTIVGSMVDVTNERRYAQELVHHERLFRTLIENMPCGVLYEETYPDGRLSRLFVNSEFTRLTGYTQEMYAAATYEEWTERTHPDDRERVQQKYLAWLESKSQEPLHLQYRFFDRYGIPHWLDNYITRIVHEDGSDGVLQVVLDITERAAAEQRLRHAASYLEQSIEPIIECDEQYAVTFLNGAALRAFPQLRLGSMVKDHPLGADLPMLCEMMESDQQTSMVTVGERTYLRLVARTERGWRLFCHDVTPLVEAEQTLRRALEREQAMNMLRSQFVSTLSHEFRTPLAGILTSAQLLDRYATVMDDQQRKETIAAIIARVRDLEHIVHSFTRRTALLGRRASESVSVEIEPFIQGLVSEVEIIRRRQAHVILQMDAPQCVETDVELLRIVLEALLDNAARYGPEDGTIIVTVTHHSERLSISVADRGVGIPEDEMERIFTLYFRSSRTGNIPGSGLSLATLKPLVEAAGGRLDLSNRPDGGILATVELPCKLLKTDVELSSTIVSRE